MAVAQVEAFGLGVDLHGDAARGGGLEAAFEVDVDGVALVDLARGGVAPNHEMRVVHGPQHPLGLLRARLAQVVVDRADHDVELRQDGVGQIEGTVGEDIDLAAVEQREVVERARERVDGLALRPQALRRQAIGHGHPRAVVGDRHVAVAALARGLHHLFQARLAVAPGGVAVQIAADGLDRDQIGQTA